MNVDISETIKDTRIWHAHSNAHKQRKPVTPTIFMLDKKQNLSIGPKKICHAHSNAHNA